MTTVVLLRHGETDWNRDRRVQGWAATPLNERGRQQVKVAGRHLADVYEFDRVLASDLRRTRETAFYLREVAGFPRPEFDAAWRERAMGDFQGLTYETVFGEFPEHDAAHGVLGIQSRPERGESMVDVHDRVRGAWEKLVAASDADETVLVVTHGGPIYVVLAHVRGMDLPAALAEFEQANCAVNELYVDADAVTVNRENDVSYRTDDGDCDGNVGDD